MPADLLPIKFAELNNGRLAGAAVVTSGVVPAYQTAFNIIKAQGSLAMVGLPHDPLPVLLPQVTNRGFSTSILLGCIVR